MMSPYSGRWHGKSRYFGLHYDLHANKDDTELGLRATPEELIPLLERLGADWVQTDCKGHPGYTSWFSQTPGASVPRALKKDALKGWREATEQLSLPLHCHYSGIWDTVAGEKHPEWGVVPADHVQGEETPVGERADAVSSEKMCPRRGYLENLMIPQLLELIDRYRVDGFWIDGDIWAVRPCYCDRCRAAFHVETGIEKPPVDTDDPNWPAWIGFTLKSFEAYVTRYCEAVREHDPNVLVCSNWLQTFRHPGEPRVPTDWISGDNAWVWGMDGSRCEARFISTRGKPWDIMLWSFYKSHGMADTASPWVFKPVEMLKQEAAVTLAFGGAVQIYENSGGLRDGRLVRWRIEALREVGEFVKTRRSLCQETESLPQIAVLHSEHHVRRHMGRDLRGSVDVAPVQGAVYSLLENHYGVDILDEWALLQQLDNFKVVVAPERNDMSDEMVETLKGYVEDGGKLLVSGADAYERFGGDFLGVEAGEIKENTTYHVPADAGAVEVYSKRWRLLTVADTEGRTQGEEQSRVETVGRLGCTQLLDDQLLQYPAATIHRVGQGAVGYIPCDLFRFFDRSRYPRVRAFVGEVLGRLAGPLPIRVKAPRCVDVVLRKEGGRTLIHLINRASGIPNMPNNAAIDEIPSVGPVRIEMDVEAPPQDVRLAFEDEALRTDLADDCLVVELDRVHIHAAVVVEAG